MTIINSEEWLLVLENTDYEPAENNTTVYKGSFTTCNQEDKKCPPWSMYAEEIIHKKDEKY